VPVTLKQHDGKGYIVVPWNSLYSATLEPD